MAKSMTGYGRAEVVTNGISVVFELKSVNHRYLEFSVRAPRNLSFLEDRVKTLIQKRVARGKIEVYISVDLGEKNIVNVEINHAFAESYVKALRELSSLYDLPDDITTSVVAKNNDVLKITSDTVDEETVWQAVEVAANQAVDGFIKMRENEGEKLVADVIFRVSSILEKVEFVEKRSPETVKSYRKKIETKIKELIGDIHIDEQRLITETAIFADKVAVEEETVRLRSHINQLLELLSKNESVGRKLDFIIQEMNREANTIGSKGQDIEIAHAVVNIKSDIEKIREQIQNIE